MASSGELEFGWLEPPVEQAVINDITALTRFLTDREINAQDVARHIREIADNEHQYLTVATHSGRVVAMATLTLKTIPTEQTGYVDDVVVHPSYRSIGVSRRLRGVVEDMAKVHDVRRLQLTSSNHRKAALSLYESLGYEPKSTNFLVKKLHA